MAVFLWSLWWEGAFCWWWEGAFRWWWDGAISAGHHGQRPRPLPVSHRDPFSHPPLDFLPTTPQSHSDDAVPIRWQCPQAVTTRVFTTKSDVYSYGVLLYEIFSGGATPYASLPTALVLQAVQAGQRLPRPRADTEEDIVALIRDCTQGDVGKRPSMAHVYSRLSPETLLFVPGRAARDTGAPKGGSGGDVPLAVVDTGAAASAATANDDRSAGESSL